MAISQFRILNEFILDEEFIKMYLEHVDLYFTANTVSKETEIAVLLSAIGLAAYTVLSNLLAPNTWKSKTLIECSAVLRKQFEPTKAIIMERFNFR